MTKAKAKLLYKIHEAIESRDSLYLARFIDQRELYEAESKIIRLSESYNKRYGEREKACSID